VNGRSDDRDEALEDDLRALLARTDAAPPWLADQARRATAAVATSESCLLEIAYDSLLDGSLGRFDPDESVRLVSFAGSGLRLDLRFRPDERGLTLSGWTAPLGVDAGMVESELSRTELTVSDDGTLLLHDLTRGRIRLHVTASFNGLSRRFHTNWFKC
jgi:hypothetical protein